MINHLVNNKSVWRALSIEIMVSRSFLLRLNRFAGPPSFLRSRAILQHGRLSGPVGRLESSKEMCVECFSISFSGLSHCSD